MCDVQLNRSIGWHRDVLQGEYEKYKKTDLWTTLPSGETYGMARLILYLEDHSNASDVSWWCAMARGPKRGRARPLCE